MKYRDGYKIVLEEDLTLQTAIFPDANVRYFRHGHKYITLSVDGLLTVHAGYPSDLASGPTFNTKNTRRGAVGHDGLYELLRQGKIPQVWREQADDELDKWLDEDGMSSFRRWIWAKGLKIANGKAASPDNVKPILIAP